MRCERFHGASDISDLLHNAVSGRCPRRDGCGCDRAYQNTCGYSDCSCGCNSCNPCDACNSCNSCNSCNNCNCNSCDDCDSSVCGCSESCGTNSENHCSCNCEENSVIMDNLVNSSCSRLNECEINALISNSDFAILTLSQDSGSVSMPVLFERRNTSNGCGGSIFLLFTIGCMCNINSVFAGRNATLMFTNETENCISNVTISGRASFARNSSCGLGGVIMLRFVPQNVSGSRCCIC